MLVAAVAGSCPGKTVELTVVAEGENARYEYAEKAQLSTAWRQTSTQNLAASTTLCPGFDSCFKLDVHAASSVTAGSRHASCASDECSFYGCVTADGQVEALGERSSDLAIDFEASESAEDASKRMLKVFDQVRKLQTAYSYDFDCVSSLSECIDDSQCAEDEYCFFATSRKKRLLRDETQKREETQKRSLLFGSNAVGQCVCS